MLSSDDVRAAVRQKLKRHLVEIAAGMCGDMFPLKVNLGGDPKHLPEELIAADPARIGGWKTELRRLHGACTSVTVAMSSRRALGTVLDVPAYAVVPDLASALSLTSLDGEYARVKRRYLEAFDVCGDADVAVAAVKRCSHDADTDFELVLSAARWFRANPEALEGGLTPRQVPLAGFSGKWLNVKTRRAVVGDLAGVPVQLDDSLRTPSFEYRYVDPAFLDGAPRLYDFWRQGEAVRPCYAPSTALIVENLDCYLDPVPIEHGIVVYGQGKAGAAAVPKCPWMRNVRNIVYWGDIDADGLEILSSYRRNGLKAVSLLMDMDAYRSWKRFGTNQTERNKRPLSEHKRLSGLCLTDAERQLYEMLTDRSFDGYRRIEQERIPNYAVSDALTDLLV